MAFDHQHRVRFHECDPAGIVYFGHIFTFCHDAWDELLRSGGQPLEAQVRSPVIFPLRHAEADYSAPMRLGDLVRIRVTIGKLSERSCRVDFALQGAQGQALAVASTVHVAVDRAAMRPVAIPEELRALLARHLEPAGTP